MAESEPFIISARDSRQPSLPKQMTNLRVPLKRGDGRAQSQNPCDTKRLLSLFVIRSTASGANGQKEDAASFFLPAQF